VGGVVKGNLHRVVRIPAKPYIPRFWRGEQIGGKGVIVMNKGKGQIDLDKGLRLFYGLLTLIFLIVTILMLIQKFEANIINSVVISLFIFCLGGFINQVINIALNKKEQDDKDPCEYRKRLENEIGILKIYPNRKGAEDTKNSYLYDLLQDFKRLKNRDTSEDDPIRMIGVALDDFFGNNTDIAAKITELYNQSAYFRILLCETDNRGLKLRTKLIGKKNSESESKFNATKLHADIISVHKYIDKILLENKGENDYLKRYYYKFSPFATIIITKNIIYYTPNMVHDDSYLPHNSLPNIEHIGSEVSFRIRRKSELGKKLTDVFDTFWLLKDKVDENEIYGEKGDNENDI
jgi:hypothetical protein